MVSLTTNEYLTLCIAAYAAIVSTFVLGWDFYKWLDAGPKVEVETSTGMFIVGGLDERTYVTVKAVNKGDRPTTITNLGGLYYESWWGLHFRYTRPSSAFIVTQPSDAQRIPYRFEPGGLWIGMVEQTDEIETWAKTGWLYLVVYYAHDGKGVRSRVRMRPPEAPATDGA